MIALQYDNARMEGQLLYEGGCMVDEGLDLETAALISLASDARAQPDDQLPAGTNRRGWWADTFDEDGDEIGCMLWLLEDALATPENARRAELYAQDALQWMIDDGHVRAIASEYEIKLDSVWLKLTLTLPSSEEVTLSPFKAF